MNNLNYEFKEKETFQKKEKTSRGILYAYINMINVSYTYNRCELQSVGTDPLTDVPKSRAVGWQYYAKCYDEKEACFGCFI